MIRPNREKGVPQRVTPSLLIARTRSAVLLLFDVVNNRVDVLVPTGVDSDSREHVQALAGSIDGSGASQSIAVLRAGGLRTSNLRATCRRQIGTCRARRRL